MDTPRDGLSSSYGYGSPPLFGRTQSYADAQLPPSGDTEMQDVVGQMRDIQLEEEPTEEFRQPFETPDYECEMMSSHVAGAGVPRLPFQSFVFNRRPRPNDSSFLLSPPTNLHDGSTAENRKPSILQQQDQGHGNDSHLIRNAPRLPASPDLDFAITEGHDATGRPEGYLPPPIFSPLYKYSTINMNNALLRENVSTNDIAFSNYNMNNATPHHHYHHHATPAQSPVTPAAAQLPLPPIMPMIGSPSPPVDRKLLLKMRKNYYDLSTTAAPQFLQQQSSPSYYNHHYQPSAAAS